MVLYEIGRALLAVTQPETGRPADKTIDVPIRCPALRMPTALSRCWLSWQTSGHRLAAPESLAA